MIIEGFGNATDVMIKQFEKHINFALPEDYKQFLRACNGGTPKVKYSTFFVEDLDQNIPLDVLYGLGIEEQIELKEVFDEFNEDLLPKTLIIGDDPGSGLLVLVNDSENDGVYYWDHAHNFEESNEDSNVYFIADSFQEFLDGLKEPE